MIRRFFVYFLIGTLVLWTPVAMAEQTECAPKPNAWAAGQGRLHLEGKGKATLGSTGDGVIYIANMAATKIKVVGKGKVIPMPKENALLVINLKGHVDIAGGKLKVTSFGPVKIKAYGHGGLWLEGKGLFRIKGKPKHKWPESIKKFNY